jgi:hypothetical protein
MRKVVSLNDLFRAQLLADDFNYEVAGGAHGKAKSEMVMTAVGD